MKFKDVTVLGFSFTTKSSKSWLFAFISQSSRTFLDITQLAFLFKQLSSPTYYIEIHSF